eukprot:11211207-Lingulodinium_polyedra.AAC.1
MTGFASGHCGRRGRAPRGWTPLPGRVRARHRVPGRSRVGKNFLVYIGPTWIATAPRKGPIC